LGGVEGCVGGGELLPPPPFLKGFGGFYV